MSKTRLYDIAIGVILIAIIAVVALTVLNTLDNKPGIQTTINSQAGSAAATNEEVRKYREAIISWNDKITDKYETHMKNFEQTSAKGDKEKAKKELQTVVEILDDAVKNFEKIKPPSEFKSIHKDYLAALKVDASIVKKMHEALNSGNQARLQETTGELNAQNISLMHVQEKLENALGIKMR